MRTHARTYMHHARTHARMHARTHARTHVHDTIMGFKGNIWEISEKQGWLWALPNTEISSRIELGRIKLT